MLRASVPAILAREAALLRFAQGEWPLADNRRLTARVWINNSWKRKELVSAFVTGTVSPADFI
jgi:hypothetical protein